MPPTVPARIHFGGGHAHIVPKELRESPGSYRSSDGSLACVTHDTSGQQVMTRWALSRSPDLLGVSKREQPLPGTHPRRPWESGPHHSPRSGKGGSSPPASGHHGGCWGGQRTVGETSQERGSQCRGSGIWGRPWGDRWRDPPSSEMSFAEGSSPQAALTYDDVCDLLRRKNQNLG